MSDSLEHRCALQSPRGTNSDYISNQEKIYIDINDLCSLYWRRQTEEEKSFGQDRGCFVQCDVGTERSLKVHVEVGQSGEVGGLLKASNSPLAPNVFGDFSHYLSVALNSKISE